MPLLPIPSHTLSQRIGQRIESRITFIQKIHQFIGGLAQGDPDKAPLLATGQAPPAPAQQQPSGGGMMMGPMLGGYFGGGFARAMEMGAGMGLAQTLVSSIFR